MTSGRIPAIDRCVGASRRPVRPVHPAAAWLSRTVRHTAQLTADSREVKPGDVFIAIKGRRTDGRRYIDEAIASGAAAVLFEATAFEWRREWTVPSWPERGLKACAGTIAADWYRRPADSLFVIGVTGTSGKTSTSLWIANAFDALGCPTVLAGTLGIGFADRLVETGMTTPDPVTLQRRLRTLVDEGARALAIEVTSIGLEEGRVADLHFDAALFTNLTRDHLDYHGSIERYEGAKAKLFRWPGLAHAIVNVDDAAGERMAAVAREHRVALTRVSARGGADAEIRARKVSPRAEGLGFEVFGAFGVRQVYTAFMGAFNVSNLLGVIGTMLACGVAIDAALATLDVLQQVPGRLERVQVAQSERPGGVPVPMVLVDYAHKPDALEKALHACRPIVDARGGDLIVVFGCGGDRDAGKRPIMGEIAARLADRVVVTSDNPRTESPRAIIDQIVSGIGDLSYSPGHSGFGGVPLYERVRIESDRREAIYDAIAAAGEADIVLIAGKGHEDYQEIQGVRVPFSDVEVATEALRRERRRVSRDREPRAC